MSRKMWKETKMHLFSTRKGHANQNKHVLCTTITSSRSCRMLYGDRGNRGDTDTGDTGLVSLRPSQKWVTSVTVITF